MVGFAQTPARCRARWVWACPEEGDRLTTGCGWIGHPSLSDGTCMTLRPQATWCCKPTATSQVRQQQHGAGVAQGRLPGHHGPGQQGQRPGCAGQNAHRHHRYRGTDFDARLAAADCANEVKGAAESARTANLRASAKAVAVQGDIAAIADNGERQAGRWRQHLPGDLVETAAQAKAVLAFRDESKGVARGGTRFKVDDFILTAKPGRRPVSWFVVEGTVRAIGLIGKAQTRNVTFNPHRHHRRRGTGIDLACETAAATSSPGWQHDGHPNGRTALQVLQAGRGCLCPPTAIRPITDLPLPSIERPTPCRWTWLHCSRPHQWG